MTELALRGYAGLKQGLGRLSLVWLLIVLIPLAVVTVDPGRAGAVVGTAVEAFLGTLPYITVAVLLIAYLKASGAETVIARAFEGRETRMIVLAALFGGLAPFCSCEVIPFVAGLLAVGAPLSAVMAFWLASPLIDPPTLFITAGALGWEFAIGKALSAVGIGLLGGFILSAMMRQGAFADPVKPRKAGGCCGAPSPFKGRPVWRFWTEAPRRRAFREEGLANAVFLFKWLGLAYLIQGLLVTYVPADLIAQAVGGSGLLPIVTGALVGMPAYLNGYAAPPLLAGLMEQGMTAGAAMAFMVAGAISSIPAMAAVISLVRRPVFIAYLTFGLGGAILAGALFELMV